MLKIYEEIFVYSDENKSKYIKKNLGFFLIYKCIELKINKGHLQGEQTLVQTIACEGYFEHMFERSGSIIYQYFDTYVTCHGLVANCFQCEEEG